MTGLARPLANFVAVLVAIFIALLGAGVRVARAQGRVTVRGVYYREASTRVVQPMVQVQKQLPKDYDVTAHYLLDAITSASVAAGAAMDNVFTEARNEVAFAVGKTWGHTRLGTFYRNSHEPDWRSNTGGLTLAHGIWDNTGTLALTLAKVHDDITVPPPLKQEDLDTWVGWIGYTQILSPTLLGQVVYEYNRQDGFIGNKYLKSASRGHERTPRERNRHALAARFAKYFPTEGLGLQLHQRVYFDHGDLGQAGPDPWQMWASTTEGRVYKMLGSDTELRLTYRYHRQSSAAFYCNTYPQFGGGRPDCYEAMPPRVPVGLADRFGGLASVDEKFGRLRTHFVEAKLVFELRTFTAILRLFGAGALELSYGRFFQETHFGNAHLVQVGYSLPL